METTGTSEHLPFTRDLLFSNPTFPLNLRLHSVFLLGCTNAVKQENVLLCVLPISLFFLQVVGVPLTSKKNMPVGRLTTLNFPWGWMSVCMVPSNGLESYSRCIPHAQWSQDRLQTHHNLDQDKAEDKWMTKRPSSVIYLYQSLSRVFFPAQVLLQMLGFYLSFSKGKQGLLSLLL